MGDDGKRASGGTGFLSWVSAGALGGGDRKVIFSKLPLSKVPLSKVPLSKVLLSMVLLSKVLLSKVLLSNKTTSLDGSRITES